MIKLSLKSGVMSGMHFRLLFALLCWSASALAAPAISIGSLYDYLRHDKSSYLKRVYNSGNSAAFVRISIAEVVYGPDGKHRELVAQSPVASTDKLDGIIASPSHLIVPAGGGGTVRLLYVGKRDVERYFRVRFVPVLPQKKDEFGLDEREARQYQDTLDAGVNVMTGYGAFLIVKPRHERYDTRIAEQGGEYQVLNAGNATVELDTLYDCEAGMKNCSEAAKRHVLPHSELRLEKKSGRIYRFELVEGEKARPMTLP